MPRSALPKHLQGDVDKVWAGTDNASFLMRCKKRLQILLAAGPRVPSGFFKWREIPITLFCSHSWGYLRFENSDGSKILGAHYPYSNTVIYRKPTNSFYLSRIQPWCQFHISIQWPLFFNAHWIYNAHNVVNYPKYKSDFGIKKMITFSIGFKRDADKVYWLTMNGPHGNFE